MKYPPDAGHPLTERWAHDLHSRTPRHHVPELAAFPDRRQWEHEAPEVREVFRERARRMLAGDMSVLPDTPAVSSGPVG